MREQPLRLGAKHHGGNAAASVRCHDNQPGASLLSSGKTPAGRKALERMNPLCTLRYSATHVDKHHMVYRLDAVDAYERKLVKQIGMEELGAMKDEGIPARAFNKLVASLL